MLHRRRRSGPTNTSTLAIAPSLAPVQTPVFAPQRNHARSNRRVKDGLRRRGTVLGYFGEDLGAAIAPIDRSLELNPSFALGWEWSGWLRLRAGQPDVAIDHFRTSMRLNPLHRRAGPYLGIGMGHFFTLRFEDAAATLLLSLQEIPSWVPTYRFLASCYAHMGCLEEAHGMVRQLRAITTEVVPSAAHWRNPEHRELFLSGLRLGADEEK